MIGYSIGLISQINTETDLKYKNRTRVAHRTADLAFKRHAVSMLILSIVFFAVFWRPQLSGLVQQNAAHIFAEEPQFVLRPCLNHIDLNIG